MVRAFKTRANDSYVVVAEDLAFLKASFSDLCKSEVGDVSIAMINQEQFQFFFTNALFTNKLRFELWVKDSDDWVMGRSASFNNYSAFEDLLSETAFPITHNSTSASMYFVHEDGVRSYVAYASLNSNTIGQFSFLAESVEQACVLLNNYFSQLAVRNILLCRELFQPNELQLLEKLFLDLEIVVDCVSKRLFSPNSSRSRLFGENILLPSSKQPLSLILI